MGVDGQANLAATDMGYPSVAVFAGGLNTIGPARNMRLFSRIVALGGALVSEVPPWIAPRSYRFLERNRLIAALSTAVLVTQARYRSGALSTARWARTIGRPVIVVPGPITDPSSGGCNAQLCLPEEARPHVLTRTADLPHLIGEISVQADQRHEAHENAVTHPRVFGSNVTPTAPVTQQTRRAHQAHQQPALFADQIQLGDQSQRRDQTQQKRNGKHEQHEQPKQDKRSEQYEQNEHSSSTTSLTVRQEIIERLRQRRQDSAQLYDSMVPHRPHLSIGNVLACLSALESEGIIEVEESGRITLLKYS